MMVQAISMSDVELPDSPSEWVPHLPDGAVSVEVVDNSLVLRASQSLQQRFEELLEHKKARSLNSEEASEYAAICDLDHALRWLNRLARDTTSR